MSIDSIHVFGWEKMRYGRRRRWILVMVQIDVTNFDDGRWRRDLLGCYVIFFPLTTRFSTTASGDFVIRFCIDSWNLSFLTTILPIHVFGFGKNAPWKASFLDFGHCADRCDEF